MHRVAVFLICLVLSGCIVLEPRAKNPFPGMTRIAVVPFFNQSAIPGEIGDLERTFALAYMVELQKVEGFDVLPIGLVDTALIEFNEKRIGIDNDEDRRQFKFQNSDAMEKLLRLDGPEDILKLAEILDVDAVVVGTITYFDPWYPPKVGLKVNWYSRQRWIISPDNEPCRPCEEGDEYDDECCDYELPLLRTKQGNSVIRGQNAVPLFAFESRGGRGAAAGPGRRPGTSPVELLRPMTLIPVDEDPAQFGPRVRTTPQVLQLTNESAVTLKSATPQTTTPQSTAPQTATPQTATPQSIQAVSERPEPTSPPDSQEKTADALPHMEMASAAQSQETIEPIPQDPERLDTAGTVVETEHDPRKPVMSYTKMFDGKNPEIVKLLRDYVEIRGDLRSGGWEGFMQRTDDYIHFCCHTMIIDMLSLHGGALKTKVWLKPRKSP